MKKKEEDINKMKSELAKFEDITVIETRWNLTKREKITAFIKRIFRR